MDQAVLILLLQMMGFVFVGQNNGGGELDNDYRRATEDVVKVLDEREGRHVLREECEEIQERIKR